MERCSFSLSTVMAVRQISITLDEEPLRFLDEWGGNRSAASPKLCVRRATCTWPLGCCPATFALVADTHLRGDI